MLTIPPEILSEIFKHIKYDNGTLHSCILVNKQWHNNNIPTLWRNPLAYENSIKIIINCFFAEDKNFFVENDIKINFDLLENPPLYNYAKFATKLDFWSYFYRLRKLIDKSKFDTLKERLLDFVLDHSTIRELATANKGCELLTNHCRFDTCFQNLNELSCYFSDGTKFFDKLANACERIQYIEVRNASCSFNNNKADYSLAQLIKAQNQIKSLTIHNTYNIENDMVLSEDFKQAISIHSKSIVYCQSNGKNSLVFLLIPTFQNLKTLILNNLNNSGNLKFLKSVFLPNIEEFSLSISGHQYLPNLLDFIKNNGKNLKCLNICGELNKEKYLGEMIQSIGQICQNLEYLSIFYRNEADEQLTYLFNNCIKLKDIELAGFRWDYILDADKVLTVLNQTLPKKLRTITFDNRVIISDANSFDVLMKNWRGPKPFTIKIFKNEEFFRERGGLVLSDLLKKYQDLRFVNFYKDFK